MVGTPFPSGNPQADSRAGFAATMAHLGDLPTAIETLRSALELAPDWAAGWFRLGEYFEMVQYSEGAIEAWQTAQRLDPSDPFGAGLKIDLLRDMPQSKTMPAAFVEMLFDQYAPRFDHALCKTLAYQGPEQLSAALAASGFSHARRALDLGCGTGLMGQALRATCDWLEGCDISQGMLEEAASKEIYDGLDKQDLCQLPAPAAPYDLIVAADVFIYVGALDQILDWCAAALALVAAGVLLGLQPDGLHAEVVISNLPNTVTGGSTVSDVGWKAMRQLAEGELDGDLPSRLHAQPAVSVASGTSSRCTF